MAPLAHIGHAAILALLLAGAIACKRDTPPLDVPAESFAFTRPNGCTLTGDRYPASKNLPPVLILLHAQGRDRTAWSAFAQRAHAQGYRVYVPDMPGHGDSVCGERTFRDFAPQDWQALEGVVPELVAHAIDNGADPDNVFVAGAGIGANIALRAALGDPRIQAVVLVSPGADYLGVTLPPLTEETRAVPMLLIATEGDSYAAAAAESLHAAAPGYAELRMRAGAASGTDLLDASAETSALTLRWLQDILE